MHLTIAHQPKYINRWKVQPSLTIARASQHTSTPQSSTHDEFPPLRLKGVKHLWETLVALSTPMKEELVTLRTEDGVWRPMKAIEDSISWSKIIGRKMSDALIRSMSWSKDCRTLWRVVVVPTKFTPRATKWHRIAAFHRVLTNNLQVPLAKWAKATPHISHNRKVGFTAQVLIEPDDQQVLWQAR